MKHLTVNCFDKNGLQLWCESRGKHVHVITWFDGCASFENVNKMPVVCTSIVISMQCFRSPPSEFLTDSSPFVTKGGMTALIRLPSTP